MVAAALYNKVEMLPLQKQQAVLDFVDFLLMSPSIENIKNAPATSNHPYAGCMSGTFGQMIDDFNEPLHDFKDYM